MRKLAGDPLPHEDHPIRGSMVLLLPVPHRGSGQGSVRWTMTTCMTVAYSQFALQLCGSHEVHVLDDLGCLSLRAQDLLRRTGQRHVGHRARTPSEFLWVRDASGQLKPAPAELVIRREGFADKFGGLRYLVRRSALLHGDRHDVTREWDFDLEEGLWPDGRGWCFGWVGEHVSSPVRFLAHTDGRVGVSDGGPFVEIASSVAQLIESHAMMDAVSLWDPLPGSSLESWAPSPPGGEFANCLKGLTLVPEASGRFERWLVSDVVAVREFWSWTSHRPRTRGIMIWTLGEAGRLAILPHLPPLHRTTRALLKSLLS